MGAELGAGAGAGAPANPAQAVPDLACKLFLLPVVMLSNDIGGCTILG